MLFFILVLDTSAVGQLNVFYPEKALFENNWLENFEKLKANFVISLAFLIVLIHQSIRNAKCLLPPWSKFM